MKKIYILVVYILSLLVGGYNQSFAITASTVFTDMIEYRKSVSQTTADEVSDKITRRQMNVRLSPITGANANSGSSTSNYFRNTNGSRWVVNSSVPFGSSMRFTGRAGSSTLSLAGGNARMLSTFFMAPYNPVPILPNASYTTSNNHPSLVGFYKSPDNVVGGLVNFKITNNANPSTQTTIYQSGSSNFVQNGSYAFWQPFTLSAGTYYWHIQAQNVYSMKTSWVYGGQLTILATAPLYTVDAYTNPIGTGSTVITGTKGTNVTITPSVNGSGSVSVSYPTSTTFSLSFTNLSEG